jgi:hypothetical protein
LCRIGVNAAKTLEQTSRYMTTTRIKDGLIIVEFIHYFYYFHKEISLASSRYATEDRQSEI